MLLHFDAKSYQLKTPIIIYKIKLFGRIREIFAGRTIKLSHYRFLSETHINVSIEYCLTIFSLFQ